MFVARCELLLEGRNFDPGSIKEFLAITALQRRNEIELQKTVVLAAASAHSDSLSKELTKLQEMMVPELAEAREASMKNALAELEKAAAKGPITLKSTELKPLGRRELGVEHAGGLR